MIEKNPYLTATESQEDPLQVLRYYHYFVWQTSLGSFQIINSCSNVITVCHAAVFGCIYDLSRSVMPNANVLITYKWEFQKFSVWRVS